MAAGAVFLAGLDARAPAQASEAAAAPAVGGTVATSLEATASRFAEPEMLLLVGLCVFALVTLGIQLRNALADGRRWRALARETRLLDTFSGFLFELRAGRDARYRFSHVSHQISRCCGIDPDALLDREADGLILPDDREGWRRALAESAASMRELAWEGRLQHPDGRAGWWRVVARPRRLASGVAFGGFFTDIDAMRAREDRLLALQRSLEAERDRFKQMAEVDGLTGAASRPAILGRLDAEIARARRYGRPLSLAMLDIDEFKSINDAFGHAIGDQALRGVVAVFRQVARDQDVIGRFGGEEFLVIMPETALDGAVAMAERLRIALQDCVIEDFRVRFTVTCSNGVAEVGDREGRDNAIRRADGAMYAAKRAGRNRSVPAEAPPEPITEAPPEPTHDPAHEPAYGPVGGTAAGSGAALPTIAGTA